MKTAISYFLYAAFGFGLLAGTSGCEQCQVDTKEGDTTVSRSGFCSVKEFTGTTSAKSAALMAGGNVSINNINGTLKITKSTSESVNATFRPFVWRAFNTSDADIQKSFSQLNTTVTADASGNVTVSTTRDSGAPSTLGANVVVEIPADFAGVLKVTQHNGSTDVAFSGNAAQLIVDSSNGSIDASANAPSKLSLHSDNGSVTASAGSINDATLTSGNGSITASVGAVVDGATGGTFKTELGDIDLTMPSTGTYAIQAVAADSVDFGTPPATCAVTMSGDVRSQTLTCGSTAPIPTYVADAQGVGGVITVTY